MASRPFAGPRPKSGASSRAAPPAATPTPRKAARAAKPRVSKAEQVYREVREQILSGRLEPGAAIDKLALCDKLGVSRFPVSSAIHRLAFERLVTIEPQHGSFVALMSSGAIREFMMIRRALESEIAAMAATRLSRADHDELARNLAHQRAAAAEEDIARFYALDVAFHQLICRPLGLEHSIDMLEAAKTHLERARRLLLAPAGFLPKTLAEHERLAAALSAGDAEKARRTMRAHLDRAGDSLEVLFKERSELFA